jgi:hypothetical protein
MSWLLMYGLFLSPVLLLGAVMISDRVRKWPEAHRSQDSSQNVPEHTEASMNTICFSDRDLIDSLRS